MSTSTSSYSEWIITCIIKRIEPSRFVSHNDLRLSTSAISVLQIQRVHLFMSPVGRRACSDRVGWSGFLLDDLNLVHVHLYLYVKVAFDRVYTSAKAHTISLSQIS